MKKITILITALLFCLCQTNAQKDTEFWFAVPDITSGDYGADNSILLTFMSYDQPTTIHVKQPVVQGFPGIDTTHFLPPHSYWVFDVAEKYKAQVEVLSGMAYPYGLHITSDQDFSVYYANTSNDSEIYTLKGKNALGTSFIVPMQYEYESGSYASAYNSIQIVATEDSTVIQVELFQRTDDLMQTQDHQTLTIQLDKGWTYAFHSKKDRNCPGAEHLHNTRINSNKPIVVNSTDDSVTPGDLVGDQLVPSSLAGTSYIAVKNQGLIEKVYIFPIQNNTRVYVDGVLQTPSLNLGDKMMIPLNSTATSITSDKPVTAFQITTKPGARELGGAILPKLECTGSIETAYRPAFIRDKNGNVTGNGEISFNIITKTTNIADFIVNGQSGIITASDFSTVPGNPQYAYCRKLLTNFARQPGNDVLRLKNNKGYFHAAAYDNPSDNSCTFGYFTDYHTIKFDAITSLDNYSESDTIHLYLKNVDAFSNIIWTKPDGTTISTDEILIPNPTESDAGFYVVTAISKDGCDIEGEGVVVVNFVKEKVDTFFTCVGDSVKIVADGFAPYKWSLNSINSASIHVAPDVNAVYTVENYRLGSNIIYNGNFQKGNLLFESDYNYGGTGINALNNSNSYSVWRSAREVNSSYNRIYDHTIHDATNGRFLIANTSNEVGKKVWTKKIDVKPNARYQFAAWFLKAVRDGATPLLRFTVNGQKIGSTIRPEDPEILSKQTAWKQFSAMWDNDANVSAIVSIEIDDNSPNAAVCIDDITFSPLIVITDTFKIEVAPRPFPIITGDTVLCQGQTTLDGGVDIDGLDFTSYHWHEIANESETLSTSKTLGVDKAGSYIVIVSNGSCESSDTINVVDGDIIEVNIDNNNLDVCLNENNIAISYQIIHGNADLYSIIFDNDAITAGFSDIVNQPLLHNEIIIPLNGSIKPGFYNALIKIEGSVGCASAFTDSIKINVKTDPNSLMDQKWNDVIALLNSNYNGGYDLTEYQWYKNGIALEGETKSYLYLQNDILRSTDRYSALLVLRDGTSFMTCDFIPVDKEGNLDIPTLMQPGVSVYIKNVKKNYNVSFIDLTGQVRANQVLSVENSTLAVPCIERGMYIIQLQAIDEQLKQYKILID